MRIFFSSDLHASEVCFRKFVNAAKFYGADVLVCGGDVAGKQLVPIVAQGDGMYRASYYGQEVSVAGEDGVMSLEKNLRNAGFYVLRCTPETISQFSPDEAEAAFQRAIAHVLSSWVRLAEERLKDARIPIFMMPGNDDPAPVVDDVLNSSSYVENADGRVIRLGDWEILTLGIANQTPWDCPRDCAEEEIEARIDALARQVERMDRCIFNIHVPPYDSGLDSAPALDKDLRPRLEGGELKMSAVGSTAVRKAIERYQPALSLHGHIHEGRGAARIGRTVCVNPGSEYQQGILHGCIIDVDGKGRVRTVLTTG